ncbi:hypothetical protein A3L09_04645 [Thermococcus profundus]|uniref:DUF835 domain-containing protein n=1 Tax=Thermococcus profundus TaxID=49899 RepID=A0A2Z2M8I1_THEPR|nr:DUF835 domain-containing protein [Thermococcus profundus]ASJ02597.1 hypothetical protein A3L09_04645 [Thermococcus profundus]
MLEILNVLMRLFTWGLAVYRWGKRREGFMFPLTLALWIDFLAALTQRAILTDLGWTPSANALAPLLSTFAVLEGTLFITVALLVLDSFDTLKGQLTVLVSSVIGPAYVLVAVLLNEPSTILFAFPLPFMGASLILMGYALIKEEVGVKSVATLFPLGALFLGIINLTYPITVKTSLSGYLYALGAIFRAMIFIGMLNYAFLPVRPPEKPITELPTGAFYSSEAKVLRILLQKMQSSGNGILITRNLLRGLKPRFPVFWVSKVSEGEMAEGIMTISPTDMGILIDLIRKYLEKGHSLVVIDCFEYLMMENGFESALKFLLSLKDYASKYGGTLVLVTDPSAYPEKEWRIITRELEKLEL